MMPTDCYEPSPPKVVDYFCYASDNSTLSPRPLPSSSIVVSDQASEKVNFAISQNWVDEAGMAVMYSPDLLNPMCHVQGNLTFGEYNEFEGECLEGSTAITVFVFFDQDFDPEECEACNTDDIIDLEGNFCVYRVEIPCDPVSVECGEPSSSPSSSPSGLPSASPSASPTSVPSSSPSGSPSQSPTLFPTESLQPTDCYEPTPPKIIESICMAGNESIATTPMPDNAIVVTSQDIDKVGFTVAQDWVDVGGLAINYNGESLESSCAIIGNITFGDSQDLEGNCIEGVSGVTIVVYMDEDFDPDECEACNVDDLSEMGGTFCAYRVEIPCEPTSVECGEPSAAPSDSFYPSSAPSNSPTESMYPSSVPTSYPSTVPTRAPTEKPTDEAETQEPTVTRRTASPTTAPTNEPTSSPSTEPTECPPDDPILIDINGSTMYPEGAPPIEITFQNTTHVGFKVVNTWETSFTHVYTEYHEGNFGETECLEEENVESHTQVDEYMATCMHNVPISIVNIWVVDANGTWFEQDDNAEVPECCHPPEFSQVPIVQYTFKLPCVDPCPDPEEETKDVVEVPGSQFGRPSINSNEPKPNVPEVPEAPDIPGSQFGRPSTYSNGPARHLQKEEHTNNLASPEIFSNAVRKEVSPSAPIEEPLFDDAEGHFCVSEDYPCGGKKDHVHVCHYSARDGYKTFCVPESDSDVLAFYKKDYCGPCIGGYGSKIKR